MVTVGVFEFCGMRCQPLRRALCLITKSQWFMIVLCSLGSLVWCFSASWLQWARFSGQLFFGAGNSANCLNQFSGKREVEAVGSISNLILGLFSISGQSSKSDFQNHESFQFFGFWVLFVNQS
ncbi:hypothetical protein [Vibrio cholerae]|uniref:hypothetical protein n=3 Tax=Vibrionaceae TaxID=641 RepID=UPI00163CE026|nr:hypothetical protein [Vibrio cholerae]